MLLNIPENDFGIYRLLLTPGNTISNLKGFSIHSLRTTTLTISAEKCEVLVRGEQRGNKGIAPLIVTSV
jgi:hypothetical protein